MKCIDFDLFVTMFSDKAMISMYSHVSFALGMVDKRDDKGKKSRSSSSSSSSGSSSSASRSSSSSSSSSSSRSPSPKNRRKASRSKSPVKRTSPPKRNTAGATRRSPSPDRRPRRRSISPRRRSPSPRRQRQRSTSRGRPRRSRTRSPKKTSPPRRLCIRHLSRNVTRDHLNEIFSIYGNVKNCELPPDRNHPHIGRGYGYVEYENVEDAEKAMKHMDGGQVDGQIVQVEVTHTPTVVPSVRTRSPPRRSPMRRGFSPKRRSPPYRATGANGAPLGRNRVRSRSPRRRRSRS